MERMTGEINNYKPHVPGLEAEIYQSGMQIASSALQTFLRPKGVPDAYDRLKDLTMKPRVDFGEVIQYITDLVRAKSIEFKDGKYIADMLRAVRDNDSLMDQLYGSTNKPDEIMAILMARNSDVASRNALLGNAVLDTQKMTDRAKQTVSYLSRYKPALN